MDRRHAVGRLVLFGVEQAEAGRVAVADYDEPAMPARLAQPPEVAAIDCARGQLMDGDLVPQTPFDSVDGAVWCVEHGYACHPLVADVEISERRIEPLEREFFDVDLAGNARCFVRQPLGAGAVAGGAGAVSALPVPGFEPACSAGFGFGHVARPVVIRRKGSSISPRRERDA